MLTSKETKVRPKNFTEVEDLALSRAYINVSEQAVTGTDQNSDRFWTSVFQRYKEILLKQGAMTEEQILYGRTADSMKSRWQRRISKEVQLFVSVLKRVKSVYHSGWNEDNYMTEALNRFRIQNKGADFKFLKCWEILRDSPKFKPPGLQDSISTPPFIEGTTAKEPSDLSGSGSGSDVVANEEGFSTESDNSVVAVEGSTGKGSASFSKVHGPPVGKNKPIGAKKAKQKLVDEENEKKAAAELTMSMSNMAAYQKEIADNQKEMALQQKRFATNYEARTEIAFIQEARRAGRDDEADAYFDLLMRERKLRKVQEVEELERVQYEKVKDDRMKIWLESASSDGSPMDRLAGASVRTTPQLEGTTATTNDDDDSDDEEEDRILTARV